MNKIISISKIEELEKVADSIIENFTKNNIIAFFGSMGAGKTTLIKLICKKMGVTETISSPTFSIVNEYHLNSKRKIFHFDFYRIKSVEEVYDLGYEDYFYSNNFCFVEWPELVMKIMPSSYFKVQIKLIDNQRIFELSDCYNL